MSRNLHSVLVGKAEMQKDMTNEEFHDANNKE